MADISVVGWCAQWLVGVAMAGLVVETALIEWGPGTWPQSEMPAISLSALLIGLFILAADMVVVGAHNALVDIRCERLRKAGQSGRGSVEGSEPPKNL